MTIPFGRRRLVVSVAVAGRDERSAPIVDPLPGATDAELARLSRGGTIDIDRARWEGLTLLYGGLRRP